MLWHNGFVELQALISGGTLVPQKKMTTAASSLTEVVP